MWTPLCCSSMTVAVVEAAWRTTYDPSASFTTRVLYLHKVGAGSRHHRLQKRILQYLMEGGRSTEKTLPMAPLRLVNIHIDDATSVMSKAV